MIPADIETDVKQEIKKIREGIFTYRSKSVKHDKIYFVEDPLMAGCFHLNSKLISKSSSLSEDVTVSCNTRLCVLVHKPAGNRIVPFHKISC